MCKTNAEIKERHQTPAAESGQSIVIIALSIVGILAFVGIAVDVGLVFARSTQLQAAVDAAALAGVVELSNGIGAADVKAGQFLNSNRLPDDAVTTLQSSLSQTVLGASTYSITVTWPVDLFFLRVINQDIVSVTRSATAAYFPQADIYASRRVDNGAVTTSNQAVFGPNLCTEYGDPFSPLNSPWEPGPYSYRYRILVPADYSSNTLRVEILDPDSINSATNSVTSRYSSAAQSIGGYPSGDVTLTCSGNQRNPCLIEAELALVTSDQASLDQVNPFWFVRIDENRGRGTPPGNGTCGAPSGYDADYNTRTLYQLYYYRQNPDGTIQRVDLASYTGQVGDGSFDNGEHDTDMRWVTPGGQQSVDQPTFVPVDPGSQRDFELDIYQDLPNILTDPSNGSRYVYLDVTAIRGSSENGFEIWAGPPDYVSTVPSDVNARNLYMLENPNSHNSDGATVFGMGRLPMNSNVDFRVEIPLVYLGPEYAGQQVVVSAFDQDSGADPPLVFYFDTIAREDWSRSFNQISGNDNWRAYSFTIPTDENCDFSNPTADTCTPFYGGRLFVSYDGGTHDTYGWQVQVTGLPYLTR